MKTTITTPIPVRPAITYPILMRAIDKSPGHARIYGSVVWFTAPKTGILVYLENKDQDVRFLGEYVDDWVNATDFQMWEFFTGELTMKNLI